MISFHEYSRTLTLVFHVNSKKAQNYMCNEKLTSPVLNKGTYMANQLY